MTTLALGIVGKSHGEIADFLIVHAQALADQADELIVIANQGKRYGSLAAIGNRMISFSQSDVVGLIHADTGFRSGALAVFKKRAAEGYVCGIVGRPLDGRYVWAHAGGGADITCLDGCAIFMLRSHGLSFDEETFDGYHCAVEDVALQARSRGLSLLVPAAQADHASTSNFRLGLPPGNPDWLRDYYHYVAKLKAKYPDLKFMVS